jgi:hypothetical protein
VATGSAVVPEPGVWDPDPKSDLFLPGRRNPSTAHSVLKGTQRWLQARVATPRGGSRRVARVLAARPCGGPAPVSAGCAGGPGQGPSTARRVLPRGVCVRRCWSAAGRLRSRAPRTRSHLGIAMRVRRRERSARATDRRTSHPRTSTGVPELILAQIDRANSWQLFRAAALLKRARVWSLSTSWFLVAFVAGLPPVHDARASVDHDQTTRRSGTPCRVACSDARMRSSTRPVKTVPHKDARIFCPAGGTYSRPNWGQPYPGRPPSSALGTDLSRRPPPAARRPRRPLQPVRFPCPVLPRPMLIS